MELIKATIDALARLAPKSKLAESLTALDPNIPSERALMKELMDLAFDVNTGEVDRLDFIEDMVRRLHPPSQHRSCLLASLVFARLARARTCLLTSLECSLTLRWPLLHSRHPCSGVLHQVCRRVRQSAGQLWPASSWLTRARRSLTRR